jgi:hypothetical protein
VLPDQGTFPTAAARHVVTQEFQRWHLDLMRCCLLPSQHSSDLSDHQLFFLKVAGALHSISAFQRLIDTAIVKPLNYPLMEVGLASSKKNWCLISSYLPIWHTLSTMWPHRAFNRNKIPRYLASSTKSSQGGLAIYTLHCVVLREPHRTAVFRFDKNKSRQMIRDEVCDI